MQISFNNQRPLSFVSINNNFNTYIRNNTYIQLTASRYNVANKLIDLIKQTNVCTIQIEIWRKLVGAIFDSNRN